MKLYCDMDGVLVHQIARDGFDTFPWMHDGRELWAFIKGFNPTILSMLPDAKYDRCSVQKRIWCNRELGGVRVIVTKNSEGKAQYSEPGAILIDDGVMRHGVPWAQKGGTFIRHVSAKQSIEQLANILERAA